MLLRDRWCLPDEGCVCEVKNMKTKIRVELKKQSLWLGAVRKIFSSVPSDPGPGLQKLAKQGGQGGASVCITLQVRCAIVCFFISFWGEG